MNPSPNATQPKSTVQQKQDINKELLVEQLKKTPIVQVVCEKIGVSRASYYRWRKDDKEFVEAADTALLDGSQLVNDLAESQLISAIKDKNLTAIIFWLKSHHAAYATRVEVNAKIKSVPEELTPEQAELVMNALRLAALTPIELPTINEQS